ncbi:hypothetical protein U1Q18_001069 [Sarracenia purpurea var. burkii]
MLRITSEMPKREKRVPPQEPISTILPSILISNQISNSNCIIPYPILANLFGIVLFASQICMEVVKKCKCYLNQTYESPFFFSKISKSKSRERFKKRVTTRREEYQERPNNSQLL